jgi:hypothetical protein
MNICICNLITVLVQKSIDLAVGEDFLREIFNYIEQLSLFHGFGPNHIVQNQLNQFMLLLFCYNYWTDVIV